jgi:hypothetical protein
MVDTKKKHDKMFKFWINFSKNVSNVTFFVIKDPKPDRYPEQDPETVPDLRIRIKMTGSGWIRDTVPQIIGEHDIVDPLTILLLYIGDFKSVDPLYF